MDEETKALFAQVSGLSENDRLWAAQLLAEDDLHPSVAHLADVKDTFREMCGFFDRMKAIKLPAKS